MVRIKVRETHIRTKSRVTSDGTKHSTKEVSKRSVEMCSANQPPEEVERCSIGQIHNTAIGNLLLFHCSICHWWDWRRADAVIDLLLRLLGVG